MKTNYTTLLFLILTYCVSAQNNDFINAGENKLWSDTANWSLKVVPDTINTGIVRLPLLVESLVDIDVSIKKIQNLFGTTGKVSIAGDKTLTINPKAANAIGIENVSNNNTNLSFKGNVKINNSAGFTRLKNSNGTSNRIEFEAGSILTLATNLEIFTGTSNDFRFNGSIAGTGNIRLAANTAATFGKTSSNKGYTGELVFLLNSKLTVNTADDSTFYEGAKIQVNGTNSSIVLNSANVFASNIIIGGANTFTFTANKNQKDMKIIGFSANGVLNLVIADSVTNITFADNSEATWNMGTINIKGFKNGLIRFGTNDKSLTQEQIAQIKVDKEVEALALDNNGFLVDKSILSSLEYAGQNSDPIIKGTVATDVLNFNTPQSNIKIVDINGRFILKDKSLYTSELNINFLKPGSYFVVFDDKIVERFVKK